MPAKLLGKRKSNVKNKFKIKIFKIKETKMKKLLAVFLALIMILSVSLVACSDKKEKEPSGDEVEDDVFLPNNTTGTTGTTTGGDNEDPEGTNAPVTAWTGKSGTVYVCASNTNIRAAADEKATRYGSVGIGYTINYTDYNGEWYKFTYEEKEAYIKAAFTDTQKNNTSFSDPTMVAKDSVIHIKTDVKSLTLRADPCMANTNNIVKGYLNSTCTANGEMTILQISDSGLWVKVQFKGTDIAGVSHDGTFYCGASYFQELTSSSSGEGGNG